MSHKLLAVGWVASKVISSFLLLTKKAAHGLTGMRVHFSVKIHKDFFFFEPRYSIQNSVFRLEIVKSSVKLFYKP